MVSNIDVDFQQGTMSICYRDIGRSFEILYLRCLGLIIDSPTAGSWKKCLESMLGWHNETSTKYNPTASPNSLY
jgi:hypothetical protein